MPGLWNPPTGGLSFPLNSTTCSITKTVDAATLKLWLRFKFKPAFCSERLPVPGCWVKVQFVYHSLLVNQTLETLFTRGTSFLLSTLLTIASFNSFLFTMAMLLMWFFFQVFILCVCVLSRSCVLHLLWPRELQPSRLLCPWDSPGKATGVACHFLLQGIFPGMGPASLASPPLAGKFFTTVQPRKPHLYLTHFQIKVSVSKRGE